MKELIKKMPFLKSEDIADSVLYVLSTAPHVQVHELMIKPIGEMS
jgi:NADP+-dependent farnesol dehydrogenase